MESRKYDHTADILFLHQETWWYSSELHSVSKEQITVHKTLKLSLYCDSNLGISILSQSFIM